MASAFEQYWKSCVESKYGGNFQQDLSPKQRGQLKMLANRLGLNGLGALTREVIHHAVNNWWQFASTAAVECGLSSYPEQPHVGFLLAHFDVVLDMLFSTPRYKANPNIQGWLASMERKPQVTR